MNPDVLRLPANHDIGIHSVKLRRVPGAVELVVSDTAILSVLPLRTARQAGRWLLGESEEEGE